MTAVMLETRTCDECSESVEDVTVVQSGNNVCDDCLDSHYTSCHQCDDPTPVVEAMTVQRGWNRREVAVCEGCVDAYCSSCERCGEYAYNDDMRSAYNGDESICEACFDYYNYCDRCDMYVHGDDEAHYHSGDESTDCCESPALEFVMPDGTKHDDIITVTLPDGIISDDGMSEVRRILSYALMDDYDLRWKAIDAAFSVGNEYVNKDGKFSKRIARWLHKTHGVKVSDDLLSKVGQAAQRASVGGTKRVAFTRQLNLSADEFYHEDSCWWGEYSYSRCTLKSNGGLGIRTFSEEGWVTGRAWAFPLRQTEGGKLVPTFDTAGADAYIVFNGYGDLGEAEQGKVLAATVEGWVSRKVYFDPGNMYVNAGGFLVGPADIVEGGSVGFSLSLHSDLWNSENMKDAA